MRRTLLPALACGLLLAASHGRAADDPRMIIEKAIQAAGGEAKIAKLNAARMKQKGTMSIMGQNISVTIETVYQLPLRYKSQMQLDVNGVKIDAVQSFDGDKGWMTALGKTTDLPEEMLKALKEESYAAGVEFLLPLVKDKAYTLTSMPEIKVNGKAAVGVKVASKGHKDIELYFDKATSMPVRTLRAGIEPSTMKEAKYEVIYSDPKEMGGVKHPTKAVVHIDGQKFMELEITELKPLDKVDPKEFAKP